MKKLLNFKSVKKKVNRKLQKSKIFKNHKNWHKILIERSKLSINLCSFFYEIFNFLIFAIVNMEKKLRNSPKNFFFYIFIFLKNWIFFLKIFLQAVERLKFFYFYTFFLVFFIKFPIKKNVFFVKKQQKVQKNVKKRQKNVKKAPFFTLFFLLVFY